MGRKLQLKDYRSGSAGEVHDARRSRRSRKVARTRTGQTQMKPAEGLSDADINALVQHVRAMRK